MKNSTGYQRWCFLQRNRNNTGVLKQVKIFLRKKADAFSSLNGADNRLQAYCAKNVWAYICFVKKPETQLMNGSVGMHENKAFPGNLMNRDFVPACQWMGKGKYDGKCIRSHWDKDAVRIRDHGFPGDDTVETPLFKASHKLRLFHLK